MRFSTFIRENLDAIAAEWEAFAKSLPQARLMSDTALRDHCREILSAIANDMETRQTAEEQTQKSKDTSPSEGARETAADAHGTLRHLEGFELVDLIAEFRAMRASVLSLWHRADKGGAVTSAIDEVTRFNEGLDQAIAESVERYSANVSASRDLFLGVLGHDLRSPLTAIAMSNHALARSDLPLAERRQATARVDRAVHEMNRLIADLLDYTRSRLGAGISIAWAPCDLGDVCREAVDAMRAAYPSQPFEIGTEGDLHAVADAPKLGQALANLLGNAVQHGDRSAPIRITAQRASDCIVVTVANRGTPIPPDALGAVFEPLVRVPRTGADADDRSRSSMGLGLFIVREIVNGHFGDVGVASSADAGTVFTMRLPTVPPTHVQETNTVTPQRK